ncbi:MAG TPA: carbohydrate-binding protein, partial [Clostridia bacterium]|nr:carbohydrate-binding protein [Clostridia bacterium]
SNGFFGGFNPYADLIRGDWFNPKNRPHHTGAVYLNGTWLVEATKLEEVLAAGGQLPSWLAHAGEDYLLNLAWWRPIGEKSISTPASSFGSQQGIQTAPCSEGGDCIGWIEAGDWVRYERMDMGRITHEIELRAASVTEGGTIEIRLDTPRGELLGTASVPHTGGWQNWSSYRARIKPLGGIATLCFVFRPHRANADIWANTQLWFAKVDDSSTTIWAQFKGVNPNQQEVEINVRKTVFYPDKPGRNYITVRGFAMRHAATPWAPPTAEQVGLIGTHWSKGWVIEDNIVSHSICSGIALGKHGDQWDNTSADTAEGYVKTIERAFENGWTRENIGHHVVRNNTVSHCEQAGIVGSLGAAFSTVTGNTIHDIHVRRLFTGAEMAGIKFHAAIDSVLANNHIYRTCLGLWLDWMAQGTRVSANLFHDNGRDLFLEVNHGPFMVDNNLFLSPANLLDMSEGGAYAHNLFAGTLVSAPEPNRETPYHPAHTTALAGLKTIKGGDNRFYNNVFFGNGASSGSDQNGFGLSMYNNREYPLHTGGNVFYNGAQAYVKEQDCATSAHRAKAQLVTTPGDHPVLHLNFDSELKQRRTPLVTTALLGKSMITGLPYENADGSALVINRDMLGKKRDDNHPTPGPFQKIKNCPLNLKVSGK